MKCIANVGRPALLLAVCLLIAHPAAGQSSLQGRVVKWGTTDPISKATVELRRVEAGSAAPYVATTAEDGTFAFAAVRPGQYRISSTRPGYVKAEYGQRWPNGIGSPLTVPAGPLRQQRPDSDAADGGDFRPRSRSVRPADRQRRSAGAQGDLSGWTSCADERPVCRVG